jgi:4-amino-4-deoxy-L-arabinose transferase-like glycosyltransferase
VATDGATQLDAPDSKSPGRWETALSSPRARMAILSIAFGLSCVLGLGSIGLWGAREKRLAACVSDMVREGHWLVPNLWGRERLEKPPLPYWMSAAAALATGQLNEWTLRVPGLVAGALVLVVVYRFACEAAGWQAGVVAGLIILSSLYMVSELRQSSNDLYLTGFCAAALACWWHGYSRVASRGAGWRWAGFFAGLAIACKGPVALVVLVPPVLGYLASERALALPRSRAAWTGVGIAVAIGLAWPAAVLTLDHRAWIVWVIEPDLSVAHGPTYATWSRGAWFYLIEWPQYLFPWAVLGVVALATGLTRRGTRAPAVVRLSWFWFFGNLAVFTLFKTRKIYYLMPAVPGLAVAAAYAAYRMQESRSTGLKDVLRRGALHLQFAAMTAGGIGFTAAAWLTLDRLRVVGMVSGLVVASICAAIHIGYARGNRLLPSFIATGLTYSVTIGLAYAFVLPSIDAEHSHREFIRRAVSRMPPDAPVYFWGEPDPSFWFYLDRPLQPVVALDPDAGGPEAYCLVAARDLEREPQLLRQMKVLETEEMPEHKRLAVLGQIELPLRDTVIFHAPDRLTRVYSLRSPASGGRESGLRGVVQAARNWLHARPRTAQ